MCKGVSSKGWSLGQNDVVTHRREIEGNDVEIVLGNIASEIRNYTWWTMVATLPKQGSELGYIARTPKGTDS